MSPVWLDRLFLVEFELSPWVAPHFVDALTDFSLSSFSSRWKAVAFGSGASIWVRDSVHALFADSAILVFLEFVEVAGEQRLGERAFGRTARRPTAAPGI